MTKVKTKPTAPKNTARNSFTPWALQGSTLIGLVVAIMVFSVLAAAVVPMISSSSHQTGAANMSAKAYLLAESGFRYAASTYLHAGDTESIKNDTLEELDGNYTLSNRNSRFELEICSYFYEAVSDISSGDTRFKAHTPGTFPGGALADGDVSLDPGLEIQIEGQFYTLTSDSQPVTGEDDNVTLAVNTPLPFYPAGTLAFPVATADDTLTPSVSNGGNLAYQNGHGMMFPLRNGRIRVNGRLLTYGYNDRTNNRFVDVRDPQNDMVGLPIPTGTRITLTKFVRLQSTGIYGSGSMQARRQVTYHTPLPIPETVTQQKAFTDRFDSKDDWTDTAGTTTSIGTVVGNSALQVDSTVSSGSDQGSLTAFNPTTTAAEEIDFNASRRGSRGFLSYDIQAKFGFDNTAVPSEGFDPPTSSIPKYFAAGLSLRLRNADSGLFSSNGYGVSFLRGNRGNPADGIPDDFVPIDDQAAIVLWKQTGDGVNRTWLAYKGMMDLTFNEDNEDSGNDQFYKIAGLLNLWDPADASGRQRSGSTRNWHYGSSATGDYDTGPLPNSGAIQSERIYIASGYSKITLQFYGWHETEPQRMGFDLNDFDRKQVILIDDGDDIIATYTIGTSSAPGEWYREEIDLTPFAGREIRIQFKFDTVDGLNNNFEGWYIDDVQIISDWPIQHSALAVNLQEAMVVRFANGTPEIRQGDRIYGHLRSTIGTVMAPPLLTGGDWSSGSPAEGTLLLNRTSVTSTAETFLAGEPLTVVGGTGRAEVAAFDQNRDLKANIIKVHFASENGIGTANTNPVDVNSRSYSRIGPSDTLQWPPSVDGDGDWTGDDGNFTAAEDFYRLIQWDVVNPAADTIHFRTTDQGPIPNAVIQDHDDTLQSPAFPGILTEAEIGLHAFGDGALNTYFDDFGIRIEVSSDDTVPPPLQQ